jgi:hypothetical protein
VGYSFSNIGKGKSWVKVCKRTVLFYELITGNSFLESEEMA